MTTMDLSKNERYETLKAAVEIIDPDGDLTPGSYERGIVIDEALRMIDEYGPEDAVRRIEKSKAHLQAQAAQLAMFQ